MTNSQTELKHHALRRLAHIVVGGEEPDIINSVLEFFVEQTILEKGNKRSQHEIIKGIQGIFLIKFSNNEVSETISRLLKRGSLRKEFGGRFSLEIRKVEELRKLNTETKDFEDKILNEWIELVSLRHNLSEEAKSWLLADLQTYLHRIFLKHGAECVVLIYPDDNRLNTLVRSYSSDEFDKILPKRAPKIMEIRKIEFPLFLKEIDDEKKKYFASLLDGTFIYTLIQVDPQTKKLLKENFKNYTFYLDTNVLYSLFDLANTRATTVEKALNLARTFGIKISVSQKTVGEMKKSIEMRGELLLKSPEIKRELGEIGATISEEEDFITAYWRAFHRTGISKQDFIQKFSHITDLLLAKNIPVDKKATSFEREILEKEKELLNESISIKKNDSVAEHDAYHRLLIRAARQEAEGNQTAKKYWFLTLDNQLLIYDVKTKQKGEIPFALFPHQLFQILRPFTQRTADYDTTFIELFSRPQIKHAQGVLPNNLAEKILTKLSSFKDLPPDIAINIMLDSVFIKTVRKNESKTIRDQKINEEVENLLVIELTQLKERLEEIQSQKRKDARSFEAKSVSEQRLSKTKERELFSYKIWMVFILIILLALVNVIFKDYWGEADKIFRGLWVLGDIILAYLILKIVWKTNKILKLIMIILGTLGFILQVI